MKRFFVYLPAHLSTFFVVVDVNVAFFIAKLVGSLVINDRNDVPINIFFFLQGFLDKDVGEVWVESWIRQ